MRHRRKGRTLGRAPAHQRALLRNLASALLLTEVQDELDDQKAKVPGRIITTLEKAKEMRPLIEKCITIARRSMAAQEEVRPLATDAARQSEAWKTWRKSEKYKQWNAAIAPVVAARRRALVLLGNKRAVKVLFDDVAPRFAERDGGYTRILRLAKPRLGDNGTRAIIEFVGVRDRTTREAQAPTFDGEEQPAGT